MAYIAFITNCFPSLSETFINSEVVNLRTRGVRIKTFSVRKPTYHSISPKSRSLYRTTTYLLPIKPARLIRSHISEFARGPARYFGCLLFLLTRKYDRALADRIKTFFHFAEGVYFTWLLRREQGAFHIHAHYAFHPSTISTSGITTNGDSI